MCLLLTVFGWLLGTVATWFSYVFTISAQGMSFVRKLPFFKKRQMQSSTSLKIPARTFKGSVITPVALQGCVFAQSVRPQALPRSKVRATKGSYKRPHERL